MTTLVWLIGIEAGLALAWTLGFPFIMWVVWIQRGRPDAVLPPGLRTKPHGDYAVWPWSLIPRAATAFDFGRPVLMFGNQGAEFFDPARQAYFPKPIGEPGSWQISRYPKLGPILGRVPAYFAFTTKDGWHFRDGVRYDDVDHYCQWPSIAIKTGVE